jgi:predicted dehydrogenase
MSYRLRTGLVGCGKIGHTHARALSGLPQSTFVAVCDSVPERAELFSRQYRVRGYSQLEQMLAEQALDMLAVCTPHPQHVGAVECAAAHRVSVLVEKPLAPDLAACDRAIAACRDARVRLGVVSQRRLYPPVVRMREAIVARKIGAPILATLDVLGWRDRGYYEADAWRGTWEGEGGGVMMNQTPHQIDLMQWFMGPVAELYGYWENFVHPYIPVEDTAVAVLRFTSGALGTIVLSNAQNPGLYGRIHVHGSNGASIGAQTESGSSFVAGVTAAVEPPMNDLWTVPGEEALVVTWQAEDRGISAEHILNRYHELQIADFLAAVEQDRPALVTGEEGRKVVEIMTAIYRSRRDRQPITFPLVPETDRNDYDGRLTYLPLSRRAVTA